MYRITQDYKGFIWIITDKGISKFDGKTFKNFTVKDGLPSNDIWSIRITPDNKIWYFSKANKLGYILNDKVYAFSSKKKKVLYPRAILQAKDSIIFNDGISSFALKDSIWETTLNLTLKNKITPTLKIIHPIIHSTGINNSRDSIFFYKKNKEKKLSTDSKVLNTISEHGQINDSLYINIGAHNYFIENFNKEEVYSFSYTSQNLPHNLKYFRYHNVNNQVQFTGMNFISYLGEKGVLKNTVSIPKNLNAHFSFIDNMGNIWSATFNKGVFMLPKEKQQVKTVGKNKKVQRLKLIKDNIYASIYKEGFFKIIDTLQPIIKNNGFQYSVTHITSLQTTFFSSEYNIFSYKNDKITKLNTPHETLGRNTFARKIIAFNGFLYGNNSFGIRKINSKKFTTEKEYQLNGASSFSKTTSQLFIGNQAGLFRLKNDSIVKLNSNKLFNKPVLSQVNLNNTFTVIGTDGFGAYITDGNTAIFINKTTDLSVQNIFIDSNKSIWLATQKGIYKVIKNKKTYTILHSYFESDGLLSNNTNSVVKKNDSLYVATDLGISILDLKQRRTNQLQGLYIKSIIVNTKNYITDSISIPYKNNNYTTVSFGAINYGSQQNLTYQYKLEPIHNKWITTNTPEINFTDLKPNTYHLELKVTNHQENEILKTVVIVITPLWWQTLWCKIGLFLFISFGIILFNRWTKQSIKESTRKNILKKQKDIEYQLYALRSQMNPHFVFNSLNAIQYFMTKNEMELSEKYLVKFSRLIRMFFDYSREKNITLEQEILLLKSYLEIEKMRFGDDFKFNFNIDESLNLDTKIPTMLLQPIVENAVNHGLFHKNGKGFIDISLKKSPFKNEFIIAIKDNGVGFLKSKEIQKKSIKKHTSRSTLIIADKIKLINESLEWHISQETIDLKGKNSSGTLVLLTFKKIKYDRSNIN